jgi:hypothetical protein
VFLLGRTTFADWLVDVALRFLLLLKLFLVEQHVEHHSLVPQLLALGIVTTAASTISTFARTMPLAVLLNVLLAGVVLACRLSVPNCLIPFSAIPVIALITLGTATNQMFEQRALRKRSRRAVDQLESGFTILRHIAHSINPTVRTALSPLLSLKDFLLAHGLTDVMVARRRDGTGESAGAALETALLSLDQIRDVLETAEDMFSGRVTEEDFVMIDLRELFEREILPLYVDAGFRVETEFSGQLTIPLHRPSFVQAIKNMVRNAEMHGFPVGFSRPEGLYVRFEVRATVREVVIDCRNNGVPFPRGFRGSDYLAFGKRGKESNGKGLGGAWVGRCVELHGGTFRKIGSDPVHLRITLPKRRR